MTFKSSYIDKAGKIVIDASRYESATPFSDGWAVVKVPQKGWGFIDKSGALVIPPKFAVAHSFREGLAAVLLDDTWGFINKYGVLVVENQFDFVEAFSEGVAVVRRSSKPKRPSLPRLTGSDTPLVSYVVELWDLTDESSGQRTDDDSEFLVIDTTGKILANLDQMKLEVDIDDARFSSGLLCVNSLETDAMGYVNKSWEFVIQPKFARAAPFSEGLARVAVIENEIQKLGFIDEQGHFVIPPTFNTDFDFRRNSSDFSEGLAAVSEGPSLTQEARFFYLDKVGQIVLATEFFYAGQFHEGLATVYDAETSRWGYIDKRGHIAIPLQYEDVHDFSEGLALVGGY